MSLKPQVVYLVPEDTARVARAIFPNGHPYLRMYDALGTIFQDRDFVPPCSHRTGSRRTHRCVWRWRRSSSSPKVSPIAKPLTRSAAASTGNFCCVWS